MDKTSYMGGGTKVNQMKQKNNSISHFLRNRGFRKLILIPVMIIITNLPVDGNFDTHADFFALYGIQSGVIAQDVDTALRIGIAGAVAAMGPLALGLGAQFVEGVGVLGAVGGDVGGAAMGSAAGDDVSGAAGCGGGGVGEGEGAAVIEGAADGEDDAEGHGGGEDGDHGGDDGADGVVGASGADDEPEEGVDEVDEEDGLWAGVRW